MRQVDLGAAARVSQGMVSRVERGLVAGVTLDVLRRLLAAAGGRLEVRASWDGAAMDRLLDRRHAAVVEAVAKRLRARGRTVVAEVSFSSYGDRGSMDLLAWHVQTRSLLVVEVKTELGALEATLRTLDVKVRIAALVARERFGWVAARTSRLLVFGEDRTVRRHLERYSATLSSVFPLDSQAVRRWIREPSGVAAGIWFISDPSVTADARPSRRVRVAPS